jgi:hypothetical protein
MGKGFKILLIIGGIFAMLAVCAVVLYVLITQVIFKNVSLDGSTLKITPTVEVGTTTAPDSTDTVVPTESAEVTPPSGWQPIDNTSQKYIAYRPNGWWYKLFEPNMETLGIDTSQIPDASEWAGIMTISRLNASNMDFESYKENLEPGYSETTQTISGRSWIIIHGKTPANELFDSLFVKYAYVTVDGKEFVAAIRSTDANFDGQESNFDIFVSVIKFY